MNFQHPIVFIDDEEKILKSLQRILRKEPYSQVFCDEPETALKWMKENPFSLVISDYRMQKMTGLDLLRSVKELSPDAGRVILSGYAEENLVKQALASGDVHGYWLKPFVAEDLRTCILKLLNNPPRGSSP